MLITPALCRAARALIGWKQPELASAAGLSLSTIVDFEKDRRSVSGEAKSAIRCALEAAGVQFLDAGDVSDGPGVSFGK